MSEKPVICRLTLEIVYVAIFIGFMGLMLPIALYFQTPRPPLLSLQISAICLFFAPIIPALWLQLRCRLIASERTLEIQGLLYRRVVPWGEIRDFYWLLSPPNSKMKGNMAYVEFGMRKQLLSHNFKNLPALLERIEAKAINARARKFEIKETRDLTETPQIFDYGNPQVWPIVLLAVALWVLVVAQIFADTFFKSGLAGVTASFAIYPWPTRLAFIALLLCMSLLYPLIVLVQIPPIKTMQKFKGQQIIVSKSGLEWRNGASKIGISWEQIQSYYFEPIAGFFQGQLCVVESDRDHISFLFRIPKGHLLREIIMRKSVNAATTLWQFPPGLDDDLLGRSSLPDVGGKMAFHYRTRHNRALLLGGLSLCLILPTTKYFVGAPINKPDSSALFMSVVLGIPTLYGWLAYFYSSVQIEREGIRHITLFGKQFIAWNEVARLKMSEFYSVTGEGKTIRIGPLISEPTHFKKTVSERSGKIWEEPTNTA